MARTEASLGLASPLVTGRAIVGDDPYTFGIPESGLEPILAGRTGIQLRFIQDGSLKAGTVVVDTYQNWVSFLSGFEYSAEAIQLLIGALTRGKRANIALTLLGYVPLRLTVPERGVMSFSPHGKIVLNGVFGPSAGAPVESWSASMSYDVVGPDVGAMPATIGTTALEAVATAWGNVIGFATSTASFHNNTFLTEVAYYRAQADGTTTGGQWERHFLTTPVAGASTSTALKPLSCALVVSLDAFGPRGGRFGRFYLPAPAGNIDSGGRFAASNVLALANNVVTALASVNGTLTTAVGSDVELVVASGRGNGENRPIRQVKIGRVPDTMRSRRTSLVEDYQEVAFQTIP